MKRIAILLLVVGCTESDVPSIIDDTETAETLCGVPLPASAPATIRVRGGVATSGYLNAHVPRVELWKRGDQVPLASAEADLAFDMTVPTSGAPIDAFLHASKTGYTDAFYFPSAPFAQNIDVLTNLELVDPSLVSSEYGTTQPNTGTVVVLMRDCPVPNERPMVTGATVTVAPAGTSTVLYGDQFHNGNRSVPEDWTSTAVITNVPPGQLTITTAGGAKALRTGHANVFANVVTLIDLYPR